MTTQAALTHSIARQKNGKIQQLAREYGRFSNAIISTAVTIFPTLSLSSANGKFN